MSSTGNYIEKIERATEWFDITIEYISKYELTDSDIDYCIDLIKYLRSLYLNNMANMLEDAING